MANTDNPLVQRFNVKGKFPHTEIEVFLREDSASIAAIIWPVDEAGEPTDIGKRHSIHMSRHELLGLAYEILHSV